MLFGLAAYFLLPNAPTSAPFFTEAEKEFIKRALHEDGIILVGEQDNDYTWTEFWRAFIQPHVILIALSGFFNGTFIRSQQQQIMLNARLLGATVSGLA